MPAQELNFYYVDDRDPLKLAEQMTPWCYVLIIHLLADYRG